ncbi:hypothetical protein SKC35_07630 [Aquirufa sp. KTFRIE-69F]|uniref:DUF1080 domain-containing protein n=1 Tax=Aquirufa originis TaxID=3096514 RepID=A0ABW6D5R2_9BACT
MKKILFLCLTMLAFTARSQEDYTGFYAKREASLKSETGWLNLAGLFWLKEGENTIGGAESNDFVFPHAEASLGKVILQNNQVVYNNQGVPGSCPGGPTAERQHFQGFMLSKA